MVVIHEVGVGYCLEIIKVLNLKNKICTFVSNLTSQHLLMQRVGKGSRLQVNIFKH